MWLKDCTLFLQEMLRLEGRGDISAVPCAGCGNPHPEYRCEDCFGTELHCSSCTVMAHKDHPLHRLQKWNGEYFEFASLKSLGLRIQLGHALGHTCPKPCRAFNDDFIIIDSHGVHEVLLDFCDCALATTHVQQLLRMSLFPATTAVPKTAATFCLLEEFHLLSLESKVSGYQFYYALMRRSDNTRINPIKVGPIPILTLSHDHNGIKATTEGACAVICPACPQPGKNLLSNWREAPPDKSWLYGLFVAIKSTCSSHNAVNMADTKSNRGLAATGLGTIDCARHNMKLPTAVGDLQKGEKYINMDYLFFSALRHTTVDILNISYDIACQWNKNLWHRMMSFPPSMQLNHNKKKITFFVPKFHLPAHVQQCQTTFSFNFTPGIGRMDGEAPERGTKEMGPGARRDTLDDFFGDWNWRKITNLRHTMLRKLKDALPELSEHEVALDDLEEGLKEEYSEALSRWKEEVEAWEQDPSQPNPYERSVERITLASVHLELAKEEASDIESDGSRALHEDCSPSMLISSGLELEEQHLQCRIEAWVKVQELYIPMVAALRRDKSNDVITPESFQLLLPSHVGGTTTYDLKFQTIEWKLRYGEARDTLRSLRSNLRAQTAVLKYKDRNLRGQGANTRARNTLKGINGRIEAASSRYQDARKALVVLTPLVKETGWQSSLRPLNCEDIQGMSDLLWGQTEGRRKLSWIWNMRGAHGDELCNDGSMEDMKIEWCKARAHVMQRKEEVELLQEEMRRILQFFDWQATSWDERANQSWSEGPAEREGKIAYARRQAALRRALSVACRSSWEDTCAFIDHSTLI
ncbi:hypothetical protein DEU56DRAFT_869093 [Suillus clintonianus]|uniref:uncharacterized protein n=1 Tax=Suillus clintonianus TaxID=1904413 RepID=UPI001B8680AA|nr:uncharacterized protein DEU56DRAFT_869093 [Suillus clintonianus]KAG2151533.1 hypothetical protein DEU56DRAFT_869093 [Suillus clintonianus]